MNINIFVNGRFHFYDLARELSKKNQFNISISSTLPKYYIKDWTGLPKKNIHSLLSLEIIKRILDKLRFRSISFDIFQKKIFGNFCKRCMNRDSNILIFFAGNGWYSSLLSNIKGKTLLIADEGSAHPITVNKLLNSEYKRIGMDRKNSLRTVLDNETELQYRIADYIIVPSTFVMNSMIENGIDRSKLFVNPYGVNAELFKPSYLKKNKEFVNILFCGHLSIQKGGHIFLHIAEKFSNNNKLRFIHVGGISEEMLNLISVYTGANFIHFDAVDQSKLPEYYQQCDIFILPSIQDGFGMVVLQAMSCGLAVICSSNSCGRDVVEHGVNGYVLEPTSFDDIVNHIETLSKNPDLLLSFQNKSREIVMRSFTWKHYGERYIKFMEGIN